MKYITVVFGIVLAVLGAFYFYVSGTDRVSLVLPMLFGILVTAFGVLDDRRHNNHPLYGSIMLAILTLIGSFPSLFSLFSTLLAENTSISAAILMRSLIGIFSLLYIVLAISLIENVWSDWKVFGHFMGDWVGRVAMTLFYFTVFLPFGLGVRMFGDPLHIKTRPSELWRPRTTGDQALQEMRRQY